MANQANKGSGQRADLGAIRHSLAHILAMAVLQMFPKAKLGIGPVIENGFYYDFGLPKPLTDADLPKLEATMRRLIAERLEFSGKRVTPAAAKKLFSAKGGSASGGKDQPFKLDLIKEFAKDKQPLTVYTTCPPAARIQPSSRAQVEGNSKFPPAPKLPPTLKLWRTGRQAGKIQNCFVDLCRGGHVKNSSEINPHAFHLTKTAGAYWRGNEKNPQLSRIYGLAFETKEELDQHVRMLEEAERRDHRKLGESLDLFSQHSIAPGAIFWHPKGMLLWRTLEKFMRENLDRAGYGEVSTPVMVKKEVFERSGHWQHYRENMFTLEIENETYVLKPMNCPESTYIYASHLRSWRDLPIRLSEITDRLHRNEPSGTLGGLFRVRQFSQDDAHIYCRPDQIESEIEKLIVLVKEVYQRFSLPLSFSLATKPEKAMGNPRLWKKAEKSLKVVLKDSKIPYTLKPGDGAFYGPKIDVNARDSIGREWTVATIQLDFQMPERFQLSYIDAHGEKQRPVMVHRAILGSFERFIGILIEHYAGAFPFWLAPVQIAVLNVTEDAQPYADSILKKLETAGYRVEADSRNETIGKKIREAELRKIPYILVIGNREKQSNTVAVRERKKGDRGAMPLEKFVNELKNVAHP